MKMKDPPVVEPVVTVEVAQHVLHYFGDTNLGIEPGSFVTRLLRLIAAADQENIELLRSVYPAHVTAFTAVGRTTWGLEWLRKMVRASHV